MTPHRDTPDLYERVTAGIISALEAGTRPWAPTWTSPLSPPGLPLRITGEPYRGINVLLLWSVMMTRGYPSPVWMTYAQAQKLGGQVRKGEHGALVCYAGAMTKGDGGSGESGLDDRRSGQGGSRQSGSGEPNAGTLPKLRSSTVSNRNESDRLIHSLKSYKVFNVAQIEGQAERFAIEAVSATIGLAAAVECFVASTMNRPGFAGGSNFQIGWSHHEQNDEQVSPRGPRTRCADGYGSRRRACLTLGGGGVDSGQDRLLGAHAA
jgi:antirestriction protein ArdC